MITYNIYLRHSFFQVTPTTDRAVTYDDESWKPSEEETIKDKKDLSRSSDVRHSKAKKVKNYLKKCKNVLGSSRTASLEVSSSETATTSATSSWYIDSQIEESLNHSEINEIEDVFEDAQVSLNYSETSSVYQVANIIEVRGPPSDKKNEDTSLKEQKQNTPQHKANLKDCHEPLGIQQTTSPSLNESQEQVEGQVNENIEANAQDQVLEKKTVKLVSNI